MNEFDEIVEDFGADEMDNIITLNDDDGNQIDFEFLDLVEYQGTEYVVLLPLEEDAEEVVILRVEEIDEENEAYVSVEDEDTLNAVFEIFKSKFSEEFNFEE